VSSVIAHGSKCPSFSGQEFFQLPSATDRLSRFDFVRYILFFFSPLDVLRLPSFVSFVHRTFQTDTWTHIGLAETLLLTLEGSEGTKSPTERMSLLSLTFSLPSMTHLSMLPTSRDAKRLFVSLEE